MLIQHLNQQLHEADVAALRRRCRTVQSPCAPRQQVQGHEDQLLSFCSNDYLGLASDPALVATLAQAAQRWGVGSGASHLVSGHAQAHADLENLLAQWQRPYITQARGLAFCSGFMANVALMTALGDMPEAVIFADKLNHASLVDGALMAKARLQRYPHNRLDQLERLLQASTTVLKLIVTDAVFSMDGDLADLPAMLRLAEQYDAWLVVDDAHGLGVLGAHGHGSLEHFGLPCSERMIWMGAMGKAVGGSGAVVVAHQTIIDALVQKARPYIYSTAAPPALAETMQASLRMIEGPQGAQRRTRLQTLIAQLRSGLTALVQAQPGWSLPHSPTPIQPLVVGSNEAALALSAGLERLGFWVPAIRPPTVPAGTVRLRITLSAAHTPDQVDALLHALRSLVMKEDTE